MTLTFPLIFDVAADYDLGGDFYGPKDPRIILEEDVHDGELVIIFNIIARRSD